MELTINEKDYSVEKLLGKGKGGYSYLVSEGAGEYVIKQIHHEPCDYYRFGDKLASERRDMTAASKALDGHEGHGDPEREER